MNPFDEASLPRELQILKIFLPFLPAGVQKTLAVYIRWLELSYTIRYYQTHIPVQKTPETGKLLDCMKGLLPPEEQAQMEQFANLFENMDLYREMFEGFAAAGTGDDSASGPSDPQGGAFL